MAPPKIEQRTVTVPLHPPVRLFTPTALPQIQSQADSFAPGSSGEVHWRPRQHGQVARPASSAWLETASEMERYVRSGESAQDIADFALGEVEGGAQTLQDTVKGTATLIRHPIQSGSKVVQAVKSSGPALLEFSRHSEDIVGGAVDRKWNHFLNASNRERGHMTGSGLMNVGLTLAPFPKATAVVSASWKGLVRAMPKGALADRVLSLPGKCYKISNELGRNTLKLRPSARKRAMNYVCESSSLPPERISFTRDGNTAYYPGSDGLRIAPDLLPHRNPPVGTMAANSRLGWKACIAHELKGHRRAAMAGKTHPNPLLEEAQASIRAARFGFDLPMSERFALLRDAASRLAQNGIRLKDVKSELWIHKP